MPEEISKKIIKIIPILALIVSIISISLTFYFNREQNLKWETQNLGKVEISDISFLMWKEFTRKEVSSIKWGFEPILIPFIDKNLVTEKIRVPFELILADPDTLERIPKSNGLFTIFECKKEAKRLGIRKDNYTILKHFRIRINLKTIGTTPIKDFKLSVAMIEPKIDIDKKSSLDSIDLLPSSPTSCDVDLVFEMEDVIPNIIKLELYINYIDANNNYNERKIAANYNFKEDCWFYSRY